MSAAGFIQSAVDPAGPQAAAIHGLWLLLLWVSVGVFVLVMAFLLAALIRGRRTQTSAVPADRERRLTASVAAAAAMTVVILLGLLSASVSTGYATTTLQATTAVSIALTGHQWWWEVEYEDAVPARRVVTANELHIPLIRPVVMKVTSRDVIHSFWAPNLQGKRDLIPGYTTAIWLAADRPAVFRAQCAEFCGLQHAHMALTIVAEPEADFKRWLDERRQPARSPANDVETAGRDVFMAARCAGCHAVRGTDANGTVAPDLTHIASRLTLGAGTLPNTPSHLRAWVVDPQASKPGNQMPPNVLPPAQLDVLVAYLESLR